MSFKITQISDLVYNSGILTQSEIDQFESLLVPKSFKKGEYLTQPGDDSDTFYIVNKGILRNFLIGDDGKNHTKVFHGEGGILGSYSEFILQEPARYYIEAVTNCEVSALSMSKLEKLMGDTKSWLKIRLYIAEASFLDKEQREIIMLSKDVLQKYHYFNVRFQPFAEQIPKHMIASYIGSTPEGLSKALRNL